ncbi:hypothetical protein [Intrasporangium sp.]|nr:hypothetical protein [Intrasporangium sp.]MDV3222993.1 DUF305 domain-containing protein [Intrasporangium sp.]
MPRRTGVVPVVCARGDLKTTRNPDVKVLAEAVVSAQEAEISTMRGLLD